VSRRTARCRVPVRALSAATTATLLVATALVVLTAAPVAGENVPLHKVPTPVLDSVRARFKAATIAGAEIDREDGKLIYEVRIKHHGRSIDVLVTPEGTVLLIKKEAAAASLPGPVARALEQKYPNATYKVIEEVFRLDGARERLAHYEIWLVTAQRKPIEVLIGPDGAILPRERIFR
jgi:hypothetical protein